MKYPRLNEVSTSREVVDVFRGYNHNLRIKDGEFFDMRNLSSDNYPILSPRGQRGVYATPSKPNGIVSKSNLCYVDGSEFVICKPSGDERYDMSLNDSPKTLISMGANVIIMPDKKYINTEAPDDRGDIEYTYKTDEVTFTPCRADGSTYKNITTSDTEPTSPQNGDLWYDSANKAFYQYSGSQKEWVGITTTYVKISDLTTKMRFKQYDAVKISGITAEAATDLNATSVVWDAGLNYIVVSGVLKMDKLDKNTQKATVTIERKMPDMDFIIESENRLWGCKYGLNADGEFVNEIYASKLGDFKNWNCFMGISTDSYAASVGTDGKFTGAVTHLGYPLFFKENCMHKIYGSYPANYQIQTTTCRGVQTGCDKSLAIVNELLFYKSWTGVCVYDGSLPSEISEEFGEERYYDAVAGSLGNKYYISMRDEGYNWYLFVYDSLKGMWHKEDSTQAATYCSHRGELYYIDYADKLIKTVKGTGVTLTNPIKWSAETGILGVDMPDKKYISRIDMRMSLSIGARVIVSAEYDSSGAWEHLFTMSGTSLRSFAIPIRPKRCDHLRLRIEGDGDAKIYSICKTIEQGSDV